MAVPAQVVISGMLVTADWIASNTTYFPLISADQKGEFGDYPKRIENAWTTIGFPNMWESKARFGLDDEAFKERFGFCRTRRRRISFQPQRMQSPREST